MKQCYLLFILMSVAGCLLPSCQKYLDIPPKNIVQDKDIFSGTEGMMLYLSRMYSQMPFEDFKYSPARQFFDDWLVTPGTSEGTSIGRDAGAAMTSEGWARNGAYWVRAFNLLRDANYLLSNLPAYQENFSEEEYNHFLGEGHFARAMVFYALAKRYGGVPLIADVLEYPENSAAELETPRATEEETWGQVLADFDKAIEYLPETSPVRGYANKYVALGFKSEAMLFAGSVAKYNKITGFGQKTKVRVIGFDPGTAAAASKKYFTEAYRAADKVIESGLYSLYMKKWVAGDKEAQYQNMVDMFFDTSSPENIYVKEYKYPDLAHGYDSYNIPRQLMGGNGYSAGNCPVLDFVELFDGFEKNSDGTIKVLDENGHYLLFDQAIGIFANAEPRLRAYVILPGDEFKGEQIEIRRGIYTASAEGGIDPIRTVNGVTDYNLSGPANYSQVDAYTASGDFSGNKSLFLSPNGTTHETVTLAGGTVMNAGGKSGPFTADRTAAYTGFTVRKWLNPNMPQALVLEGRSEQHFILMRYAEILLNAAEAGAELILAGETTLDGDNLEAVAYDAIRSIRERAGADPLITPPNLELIRRERRKELAFEHKILWDIRRWRTQHSDRLNGLTQQDGAYYRGLYPFYSTDANAYFFDAGFEESRTRFRMTEQEYYLMIPADEVAKSPVIDQQPGR
ncbi:putative outer membrane starch-binding protein [Anseongella ginsenosidimutans]|uniref:Putative outer membrane starch-binding protein n=1 Tax=Anseongella ginsenosidimutans TaxID=496056 RepID=A0A4R3KMN6_9SPHI|nr:RagB/SusD family nutrient uptake outer membrane protein [Anseongella ginsenosidimutans]QEC51891.1 RagB/SusD family nutrient uptake outer membrane protein [Anseongella ginsenosidimutans]TCS85088.1 putative outer membrane starch-binding protein [Anseongella ginsenosidimutans]